MSITAEEVDLSTKEQVRSVFADQRKEVFKHQFAVTLRVGRLIGGIPSNPNVAEGWIRSKMAEGDDIIRQMVAETMVERGISSDEAAEEVAMNKHLNGFKRDEKSLYIEGRQAKAMLKESFNIRWPKARWGISSKGTKGFIAEHVFVPEEKIHLGVTEPTGIQQRFVHTHRGNAIQLEEYVDDCELSFTVITDYEFTKPEWAQMWVTAELEGIGACRSQGYGQFAVIRWEKIK